MKIRQYAKECGVEVVGKLTRYTPNQRFLHETRYYIDEKGNEFTLFDDGSILIVTADGSVIFQP